MIRVLKLLGQHAGYGLIGWLTLTHGALAQHDPARQQAANQTDAAPNGVGLPLWELGVAGGVGWMPDYPAASSNSFNAIPLPYIVYRGDFLRMGEGSIIRGRIVHTEDFEFDVSLDGSFPANDNDDRAGMPGLDWLGEIGPRLQYTLARDTKAAKIEVEVPVRAVFSTDFSDLEYRGWVFNPALAYQNDRFLDQPGSFKLSIGPVFGSAELNEYFYQVDAAFATPSRPRYEAEAGYMGTEIQASYFRPLTPWLRAFAVVQANVNTGAANESSPLYKDDINLGVGTGVVLSLVWSKQRVSE